MTRIFLYEHITALGIGRDPASPEYSLFVEGSAMLAAIREDFAAIPGVELLTGSPEGFGALAAKADWSFVIAPETDGVLLGLAEEVLRVGGRLLGPSPGAIALTSDKSALFQHWKARGVPTPVTAICPAPPSSFPCVVKRRDGAGSEGMRIADCKDALGDFSDAWIAQPLIEGISASVVFIASPNDIISLPPTFQRISDDGAFRYSGGGLPIAPHLAARAARLGRIALAGITGLLGYLGVDVILGSDPDGRDDMALEINPRLTTSYVGLRAHLNDNLAALILGHAEGKSGPVTLQAKGRVAFTASGFSTIYPSGEHWNDPSEIPANPTFFS